MSISNAAPAYSQASAQAADPSDPLSNPWVVGLIGVSACAALAGTGCLLYGMRPDSVKPPTLTSSYSGESGGQTYDRTAGQTPPPPPAAPPSLVSSIGSGRSTSHSDGSNFSEPSARTLHSPHLAGG